MTSGRILVYFCVVAVVCIAPCWSQQAPVTVSPTELSGEEGEDFTFVCTGPSSNMQWFRSYGNGTEVKLVESDDYSVIISIDNGTAMGTLVIKNAGTDKAGNYICKVTSPNASQFSVMLTVYPVKVLAISPAAPVFVEGSDLMLNCTVNGVSEPVTWTFNSGSGPANLAADNVQIFDNGSVLITGMTTKNAGIYTCTHTFPEGMESVSANVGGEITLTADRSVKFTEGDRALLKCEARVNTAALLPNVTWLVDGADWQTACANRCKVDNKPEGTLMTSQLEINKITMEDRLNYTCIASNGVTEESSDILLRVRDRLAALWPFLGIVTEVVILILIIFIHEKCSQGEDIGEEDEDDEDIKKEKAPINDGDSEMRKRPTNQ